MSIATQIARLQTIKAQIQNALVNKGVTGANTHNMENFADDIESITTGIDISDTTATAEHVETGYQFYGADGVKKDGELTIEEFTLATTGSSKVLKLNHNYRSTKNAIAISNYTDLSPTEEGAEFVYGYYKMMTPGYAYSEKPSGGRIISSTANVTSKAWVTIRLDFIPRVFIFKHNGVQPMFEFDVVNSKVYSCQGGTRTDVTSEWLNTYIYVQDNGIKYYAQSSLYTTLNYTAVE